MKQYFYIGNIKNTFMRRFVLCLCVFPAIILLIIIACLSSLIEGLKELDLRIVVFFDDLFRVFKKTWKKKITILEDNMKKKPTGFIAVCQCGETIGALDYKRTDQKEAGQIIGAWLAAGCKVLPKFESSWSEKISACNCKNE